MADVKLVIKMPEELYKHIKNDNEYYFEDGEELYTIVENGTPYDYNEIANSKVKKARKEIDDLIYKVESYVDPYSVIENVLAILDKLIEEGNNTLDS